MKKLLLGIAILLNTQIFGSSAKYLDPLINQKNIVRSQINQWFLDDQKKALYNAQIDQAKTIEELKTFFQKAVDEQTENQ